MNEDISAYQELLNKFRNLPKRDMEPTYLELCRYPYNRFEEICSRILQFYFNPKAEHGFKDLWLVSLFQAIGESMPITFDGVNINTEEYAEGKRIDITIVSSDFVVAIENKITADVYNPLAIYRKYIENTHQGKKQTLLVLSLKPISGNAVKKHDFLSCLYKDLFNAVYSNLGDYITHCNQKYLTYMLDFMKTIDNMDNLKLRQEDDFFFQNKKEIEELQNRFNDYKNRILNNQKAQIAILQQQISELTQKEWWIWQGWDLGMRFNKEIHCIGIEANYEETKDNPCGLFHTYITTWHLKDWPPYKEEVLKRFPEQIRLDENADGRVYVHLPIIEGNDHEKILNILKHAFEVMRDITSKYRNEASNKIQE